LLECGYEPYAQARDIMNRILSNLFFLAAVVFLGLAGWFCFAPAPGPSLKIADTDIDVGSFPAGRESEVAVHLTNTSSKPMRILGLAEC
jgi:hypothetical protein